MPVRAQAVSVIDDESIPWVPLAPYTNQVFVKYFRLDSQRGEVTALVKAPAGVQLPRHRNTGTVMAYTLAGRWKVLEEDWIAGPGSLVVMTAAASRTPQVIGDNGEALVLTIVAGDRIVVDREDKALAIENCDTDLRRYLAWCAHARIVPKDITVHP